MGTVFVLRRLVMDLPAVPVILESRVRPEQIADELRMAHKVLEPERYAHAV